MLLILTEVLSISASEKDVLTFSSVGFTSQSVNVGDKNSFRYIVLVEEVRTLNEVVVLGSTVRVTGKELGNAVTTIKSEGSNKAKPVDLSSAIQEKLLERQFLKFWRPHWRIHYQT